MEQTAIKPGAPPLVPPPTTAFTAERPRPQTREKSILVRCLEVAASLRVTVVLFTLSIFLIYFGTWAQKDASIQAVVNQYFRSLYVFIPLKVLLMYSVDNPWDVKVPYPGGWLLGGLLLANLLAAHAVRFKLSWKRSGILLIHAGLIVIMLGELITGLYAVEGNMNIMEGNSANYVEHTHASEFAIIDRSDPTEDREILISGQALAKAEGGVIQDEELPFDVEVVKYLPNAPILLDYWPGHKEENPATAGIGLRKLVKPRPPAAGVDTEQRVELPAAYVKLKEKGTGKPLGTFMVSVYLSYFQAPLDEVVVNGKRYGIALRYPRDYRDYAIQLLEFRHDKYVGTETARNYSSDVKVLDLKSNDKEGMRTRIYMNHPLTFQGETFYQAGLHPLSRGTVLQVVRNPGSWLPYIACLMVSGGMLVHFGLHLIGFLKRRQTA